MPTFDLRLFAERQAILEQTDQDLALQQDRLTHEEELAEIERQQLASLEGLMDAISLGTGDVAGTVAGLEAGQGAVGDVESAAASLYAPEDNNPAAARMFGDAREGIEELIIRAARDTHSLPGVSRAGLSLVQWRCLLQALIWQESRFQIGARSPVGAFGLTQIMPATASDLGINPAYYDDPYLQVTGGARYLAMMLNMFDGNIIHALAAYNAGPGNVQDYGGVPPFAETQHYVVVIPQKYNSYLAAVGGIDALGTIDPSFWRMRASVSRPMGQVSTGTIRWSRFARPPCACRTSSPASARPKICTRRSRSTPMRAPNWHGWSRSAPGSRPPIPSR